MTYKLYSTQMLFSWFLQLVRYYTALGVYNICLQCFYKALAYFRSIWLNYRFLFTKKFNVKKGSLVQSNYKPIYIYIYMHHRRLFFVKELDFCTTISETTLFISAMTVKHLIFEHWTVDYSRPDIIKNNTRIQWCWV